jgi:hypothetical protein
MTCFDGINGIGREIYGISRGGGTHTEGESDGITGWTEFLGEAEPNF